MITIGLQIDIAMENNRDKDSAMFNRLLQDVELMRRLQIRFAFIGMKLDCKGSFTMTPELKDDGVLLKVCTTLSEDKVKLLGHFSRAGAVIEPIKEGTNIFVAKNDIARILQLPTPP